MQLTHQQHEVAHQQHRTVHHELIHHHLTKLVTFTIQKNFIVKSGMYAGHTFLHFFGLTPKICHQHMLAHQHHELALQHHKLAHPHTSTS